MEKARLPGRGAGLQMGFASTGSKNPSYIDILVMICDGFTFLLCGAVCSTPTIVEIELFASYNQGISLMFSLGDDFLSYCG